MSNSLLTLASHSKLIPLVRKVAANFEQTSSDTIIIKTINSHLEANSASKSLKLITLIDRIRHEHTNYDTIRKSIRGCENYGKEHHQLQSLISEAIFEVIIRQLQTNNSEQSARISELETKLEEAEENQARTEAARAQLATFVSQLKSAAATAVLEDGSDLLDELILSLLD